MLSGSGNLSYKVWRKRKNGFFLRFFFLCGPFLKSLHLLQYCSCFMFLFWPRGMWDFGSLTRDQIHTPCLGRGSLNHWTTKEVSGIFEEEKYVNITGTFHICQRGKNYAYKSREKHITAVCGSCEPAAEDLFSIWDGFHLIWRYIIHHSSQSFIINEAHCLPRILQKVSKMEGNTLHAAPLTPRWCSLNVSW